MNQSHEFFAALTKIIHTGHTATLSATTACWRLASISIKAGEVYALRYGDQIGLDALSAFKSIQVERFSYKSDCSNLLYKPTEKPVSTQAFLKALSDRIVLPANTSSVQEQTPSTQVIKTPPAQQLKYRGQPVKPVGEADADPKKKSATVKTWAIQYPKSPKKPQPNYRGKPVRPASEQLPNSEQDSTPAKTWNTQYRGSASNSFRRQDPGEAA